MYNDNEEVLDSGRLPLRINPSTILNNNSVRIIASMLSPQSRQKLVLVSRDLLRALPPPSVVRHQSMAHPRRKRKRAISPVRNIGHGVINKQIKNKYRELQLRGNIEKHWNNLSYRIIAKKIAKILDRELFHGVNTVARTSQRQNELENMIINANVMHKLDMKNRSKVYNSRTGISKLFTPIGISLDSDYKAAEEAKFKRAMSRRSKN